MLDALTVVAFSTQENKGGYALLPGSGLSRAGASAAGLSNYALEATPGPALANLVPDLALAKKTHTCRFERILETIVQGNESRCPKNLQIPLLCRRQSNAPFNGMRILHGRRSVTFCCQVFRVAASFPCPVPLLH